MKNNDFLKLFLEKSKCLDIKAVEDEILLAVIAVAILKGEDLLAFNDYGTCAVGISKKSLELHDLAEKVTNDTDGGLH